MSKAAEDTLEKVSGEFEAEVTAELEKGRNEGLAKLESVRNETKENVAKILETGEKQAEATKRQIIGAAELDARNFQLKALEKAINETFDLATKELSELSGAPHEEAMERLIKEGIGVIGERVVVQCSQKDRRVVASAIKKLDGKEKVTLGDEHIESIGGVVLADSEGSVRFDNTFEARLERMKPNLRKEVATILTGNA